MKKIGLFYSFKSVKTAKIAEKILAELKDSQVESVNAENVTEEQFLSYDNLILGVPTWFDGELPTYWDEFGAALEDLNLKGKQVALYGLGDQVGYPESFLDAVGIMAELLESCGAEIVGLTPTREYKYEKSRAVRGENFLGLAIDFENQSSKNKERVKTWVERLRKEFK